jgi:hypothetical protein
MANKPKKATRKKSPAKVRDLAARKNPKGGAQKREEPSMDQSKIGGSILRPGKRNLS